MEISTSDMDYSEIIELIRDNLKILRNYRDTLEMLDGNETTLFGHKVYSEARKDVEALIKSWESVSVSWI